MHRTVTAQYSTFIHTRLFPDSGNTYIIKLPDILHGGPFFGPSFSSVFVCQPFQDDPIFSPFLSPLRAEPPRHGVLTLFFISRSPESMSSRALSRDPTALYQSEAEPQFTFLKLRIFVLASLESFLTLREPCFYVFSVPIYENCRHSSTQEIYGRII